eukprot:12398730-Ditylum_brightwellii.AAC.1
MEHDAPVPMTTGRSSKLAAFNIVLMLTKRLGQPRLESHLSFLSAPPVVVQMIVVGSKADEKEE